MRPNANNFSLQYTMLRYLILLLLFSSLIFEVKSQEKGIIFVNQITNKTIYIPKGGMLMVEYNGYLKQMELSTNTLLQLNDSSIVLGKYRLFGAPTNKRIIKTEDITGFRKISVGSQFLKTFLTLGVTLGSYYAFSNRENLNSTQRLAYSLGTGIVTTVLLKVIFPIKKVKYKLKDGWKMIVQ